MNFYLAPLEGVTTYIFRRAVFDMFGEGVDKYFTPFFVPHTKRTFTKKEAKEISPEHNQGMKVIPQIMVNDPYFYFEFERKMMEFGYDEINLNLGCPSGTVVSKGRGAGFLAHPTELDRFLDEVYSKTKLKLSIKTRIGIEDPAEFEDILKIYAQYPMEELIIHPRVRKEFYNGKPHQEAFFEAAKVIKAPLCYNGDIWEQQDLDALTGKAAAEGVNVDRVMIGRGMIANPGLIRELTGGPQVSRAELKAFLERLLEDYKTDVSGDYQLLYRMKEMWTYMIRWFPGEEKLYKKILKSKHISEYKVAEAELLG